MPTDCSDTGRTSRQQQEFHRQHHDDENAVKKCAVTTTSPASLASSDEQRTREEGITTTTNTFSPMSLVQNTVETMANGSSVFDETTLKLLLKSVPSTASSTHQHQHPTHPLLHNAMGMPLSLADGGCSSMVLDNAVGMLAGAIRLVQRQQQHQQQHHLQPQQHHPQQRPQWVNMEYDEGMNYFTYFIRDLDQPVSNNGVNDNIDVMVKTAALTYNLGQALYRHNSLCGAMECFLHVITLIQHQYQTRQDSTRITAPAASAAAGQQYHPLLIPALHNVGYVLYRKGKIDDAIVTFQKALKLLMSFRRQQQQQTDVNTIGNGHGNTITMEVALTHNCLGVLYFHQQQRPAQSQTSNKALEHLSIALSLQRQRQQSAQESFHDSAPADQRSLATTLNNIGRVLYNQQQFEDAMEVYEEALALRRSTLGLYHLDVAATVFSVGQTLQKLSRNEDASVCYREFLQIAIPRLGQSSQDVGHALKSMAEIYCQRHERNNNNDEQGTALSLYADALTSFRASLGMHHPEVASILNKMGNICYHRKDYGSALDMYLQGLQVERVVFAPHHPNIIVTLYNIAQIYKQCGDHDSALAYFTQALTAQTAIVGRSDPSVAVTISNIAMIHYQKKNYAMSLQCHQEALLIRRQLFGDTHLEVASSLNSVGLALFKLGIHQTALETFRKSLKIRFDLLGEHHKDVAIVLYNMATIELELGNDDEALRMYRETLRVEKAALGLNHLDLVSTLQYIAQVHQRNGEHHDAIVCYEDACRIQRLHLPQGGIDTVSFVRTLNNMANLHLQVGNARRAVECMSEGSRMARSQRGQCGHRDVVEFPDGQLHLVGFYLYGFAVLHPEHAAAA